jgi:hypothetical protein
MSNLPVTFMSGPRLKLVLDGVTVAHCIGFNLSVRKTVRPVFTMGEFGPLSLQTMLFDGVEGSFQIQMLNPYIAQKVPAAKSTDIQKQKAFTDSGANIDYDTSPSHTAKKAADSKLNVNNTAKNISDNVRYQFDAAKILLTSTFTIEVWQWYPDPDNAGSIKDIKQATIEKVRLSSCRTNISLAQLVDQAFTFTGAYCKVLSPALDGATVDKIIESDVVIDAQS